MSVHKDKKTGKWYVSCRYDNWDGARKQKMKRGFETKREAQAWEREFLQIKSSNLDMTFGGADEILDQNVEQEVVYVFL